MARIMRNAWLPLLIVAVVVIGGFTVLRVKSFYTADQEDNLTAPKVDDSKPFKPKVVKYEIFGSGSYADINYLDLDSKPVRVDAAALPWSLTLSTTAPSVLPNIVAQGDGSSISCRITVDDVVKDTRTTDGVNAQTFCLAKNA
jgi:hypothetical protein